MEQTLGKRISQHRKRLGLTQDQLAESLGVTAQAVSKWENDQSCPDINMLPKLAQMFGTSVDSLLGNDTQPVHEAEVVQPEEKKKNWEFHWDGGRRSQVGLAVVILALGIQLIISSYLGKDLSFGDLLWPTLLLGFGAWGLLPRFSFFRFGCFLFGGYFLLEKWELIPIAPDSNIVFPVILVLLGLSVLADATNRPKKNRFSFQNHGKQNYEYVTGADSFALDASFGGMEQVIDLSHLHRGSMDCCFGSYTVDLTRVNTVSADCTLDIDCSFGQFTLIVPSRFAVANSPSTSFGNAEVIGHPDATPAGTITLNADVSFGKITIQYD